MKTTNAPAVRARADIPNENGFMLELVRADGSRQLSRVVKDALTGCHYCATPSGKRVDLTGKTDERPEVVGWLPHIAPVPFAIPGCVAKGSPRLNTRDQLCALLASWGTDDKPPAKGDALLVAWPKGAPVGYPVARITVHDGKSTDGKTLFACQFYARA